MDYESIPITLPSDIVEASNGFSLDIGCSTAKLIYRSKDDYEQGKPKKEQLKSGEGRVYLIPSLPRTELDGIIELINRKCDLIRLEDKPTVAPTTGAGCNIFKTRLEKGLGVTLQNRMEFDCFIKAFFLMTRSQPADQLFYPLDETVKETAQKRAKDNAVVYKKLGIKSRLEKSVPEDVPSDDSLFPCIIGMCGSAVVFMKVEADGSWDVMELYKFGGRMFLGLSALLTGEKDFTKIYDSVVQSSCRSVDEFPRDIVSTEDDRKGDDYNFIKDYAASEKSVMSFGKGVTKERSEIKDGDILHSLFRAQCVMLYQIGSYISLLNDARRLYFCGNLINNEFARNVMSEEHWAKQHRPAKRLRLEFIKHGGHLGALGAFMYGMDEKKATENTDK